MQLEMSHNSLHFLYHQCVKNKDWGGFGVHNSVSVKELWFVPFQLKVYFSLLLSFLFLLNVSPKIITVNVMECSISVKWIRNLNYRVPGKAGLNYPGPLVTAPPTCGKKQHCLGSCHSPHHYMTFTVTLSYLTLPFLHLWNEETGL